MTQRTSPRKTETLARVFIWLYVLAAVWTTLTIPIRLSNVADAGYIFFSLFTVPAEPSLVAVVFLIAVATTAARRLRVAHTAMLVVAVLSVLATFLNTTAVVSLGPEYEFHISVTSPLDALFFSFPFMVAAFICNLVSLVLLIIMRPAFPGRIRTTNFLKALGILLSGLAVSFLVALLASALTPVGSGTWSERVTFAFSAAIGSTTGLSSITDGQHPTSFIVFYICGAISALALIWALIVMFRIKAKPAPITPAEELEIRRMVLDFGDQDSLAYFATRRDKSAVFSADRKAAVLYGAVGNVFVASGDPVGDPSSWPHAIEAWHAHCRSVGARPVVLACSQESARLYRGIGLSIVAIGDEAIINTADFNVSSPALANIRKTIRRMNREGITAKVARARDLPTDLLAQLENCRNAWRHDQVERGFSMALGRLGDPADSNSVIAWACDSSGYPIGFLSFVPWGRNGLSLDVMVHSPTAVPGITDFLVAQAALQGRDMGIKHISLNFAVFRDVFVATDELRAGPLTRASDRLLKVASRSFQIESLYRANQKYQPQWSPRWVAFDDTMVVFHALYSMGVAEGFIPPPSLRAVLAWVWASLTQSTPTPLFGTQPTITSADFLTRVKELDHEFIRPPSPQYTWSSQQRHRIEHKRALESAGVETYPVEGPASTTSVLALNMQNRPVPAPGTLTAAEVTVRGRVRSRRRFGGLVFMDIEQDGAFVQSVWNRSEVSDWHVSLFDVGDFVSVTGHVGTTDHGELSVFVEQFTLLAKAIRPTPALGHPVGEEERRTNRSLDLLTDVGARDVLVARSSAIRSLRDTLHAQSYMEVETPMLHTVHGGAAARPFTTHINAYDMDLSLRIAPELYLKRLMVGGMDRIFEIGRNFRNEGVDATHNPEFTSLEAYASGLTYHDMERLTIALIENAARAVHSEPVAKYRDATGQVQELYLPGSWRSMTIHEAVSRAVGQELTLDTAPEVYRAECARAGIEVPADASQAYMLMELYDELVEKQTVEPTFYYDFPAEKSPLARPGRRDSRVSEQWDLVAFGMEVGTAYSELIDPMIQRERLTEQSLAAAAGDPEAMEVDEAFLTALEMGAPPMGGLGLGVDRVVMMLTATTIRQTLTFPFLKPTGN